GRVASARYPDPPSAKDGPSAIAPCRYPRQVPALGQPPCRVTSSWWLKHIYLQYLRGTRESLVDHTARAGLGGGVLRKKRGRRQTNWGLCPRWGELPHK